jgi:hypothetical protein
MPVPSTLSHLFRMVPNTLLLCIEARQATRQKQRLFFENTFFSIDNTQITMVVGVGVVTQNECSYDLSSHSNCRSRRANGRLKHTACDLDVTDAL